MSNIDRRNFLKLAGIGTVAAAGFVATPNSLNLQRAGRVYAQGNEMAGKLFIQPGSTATIHTYIAPEQSAAVTSHDRYFLDQTVDRVVEIRDGDVTAYTGGYTEYLELIGEAT